MGTGAQKSTAGKLLAKNCKLCKEMDVVRNGGRPSPEEKVFPQSCSPGSWPGVEAVVFLAEETAWAKAWGAGGSLGGLGKGSLCVFSCMLAYACVCMCVYTWTCVYVCGVRMQVYTWVQVLGPNLSAWQINSSLSALRLCFYLCSKST